MCLLCRQDSRVYSKRGPSEEDTQSASTEQSWKLTISCLNAAKIVLELKLGSSAACQPHKSGC